MDRSKAQKTIEFQNSPLHQPSAALLPIMAAVFIAFFVIGLALPVLPLHVHQGLGLGSVAVGLVAGSQFGAAILSRVWAGRYADSKGSKAAVITGLLVAVAAGLVYLFSLEFVSAPVAATVLLLGRALLGVGESFIIVGAQSWGLALVGVQSTGKVLAWVGSAMFAAFALGAPIGTIVFTTYGFAGIAAATILLPLVTLLFVAPLPRVSSTAAARTGLLQVMTAVWVPGLGAALSSIGFGAITAFSTLFFVARGWPAWPAFTAFASVFILTRLVLGHLTDRFGGARIALPSVIVEAAGLGLIWSAPSFALSLLGAALSGFGYSLVYPGLGVEAVQRAPAHSRGLVTGAYTAFLDVALGLGTPALGLLANFMGIGATFAAGMVAALFAAGVAAALLHMPTRHRAGILACPGGEYVRS